MFNKLVIYEYISRISKNDIKNFGLKQRVNLEKEEIDLIYYYIKNRYNDIINNTADILNEIRDNLSNEAYFVIVRLYDKYRDIINSLK